MLQAFLTVRRTFKGLIVDTRSGAQRGGVGVQARNKRNVVTKAAASTTVIAAVLLTGFMVVLAGHVNPSKNNPSAPLGSAAAGTGAGRTPATVVSPSISRTGELGQNLAKAGVVEPGQNLAKAGVVEPGQHLSNEGSGDDASMGVEATSGDTESLDSGSTGATGTETQAPDQQSPAIVSEDS
jgi:hypothetical protein